jgi:hypothetical protein
MESFGPFAPLDRTSRAFCWSNGAGQAEDGAKTTRREGCRRSFSFREMHDFKAL